MGNRDKRDDKAKKPKKNTKQPASQVQVTDVPPPVELVRKKRKEHVVDDD